MKDFKIMAATNADNNCSQSKKTKSSKKEYVKWLNYFLLIEQKKGTKNKKL